MRYNFELNGFFLFLNTQIMCASTFQLDQEPSVSSGNPLERKMKRNEIKNEL